MLRIKIKNQPHLFLGLTFDFCSVQMMSPIQGQPKNFWATTIVCPPYLVICKSLSLPLQGLEKEEGE